MANGNLSNVQTIYSAQLAERLQLPAIGVFVNQINFHFNEILCASHRYI